MCGAWRPADIVLSLEARPVRALLSQGVERVRRFVPTLRAMVEPGFVAETVAPRPRSTR